ncbi:MAG: LacI family transcriptional regulator [Pirellulales bacterium]|nr:LacI family transcriptional regulator [Pirellulales bacterium]
MKQEHHPRRPGVRSLAKATGLSVATISRVLNNSDAVTEATRERVLNAMRDAGYVPNPAARALATNRTRTIGAVVPTVAHSIFARFLNAIEIELAMHGYALVIATTDNDLEVETRRAKELLNLGAEGLILSGADHQEHLLSLVAAANIPTVCTSIHRAGDGLPSIGYNNARIAYSAIQYLSGLGHSKIAVLHGPEAGNDRTQLRLAGVHRAARKFGATIELHPTTLDADGGTDAAREMFDGVIDASAVLCLSDIIALGVLFEANRRGIRIPQDVSLMGFDDLDWAAISSPPLTTIRLPTGRMGQKVALALVRYLDDKTPIKSVRLDAKIVERGSTAHAPR